MTFIALTRHPQSVSRATREINARVQRIGEWSMAFTYVLNGDLDQLKIPSTGLSRWGDRLWEHTCFEAFVGMEANPAYYEFNFSPSGERAAYAFRSYRDGRALENAELTPEITVSCKADHLELNAVIDFSRLSGLQPKSRLRLGLSAVIEEQDGKLSFWALRHPEGNPDFHHPIAFALELELPDVDRAPDPADIFKL